MKPEALKVIVVDQHEDVCHRLGRGLETLTGVHVLLHTTDLTVAAELIHECKPDVILADFNFGPTDRPEVARWLNSLSPDSALIVYSSYYLDDERQGFEDAGAARCLLKGLTLRELEAEMRETVDRARISPARLADRATNSGSPGSRKASRKQPPGSPITPPKA